MERYFCLIKGQIVDGKEFNHITPLSGSIHESDFIKIYEELAYYYREYIKKDRLYNILYNNINDLNHLILIASEPSEKLINKDFEYLTIQVMRYVCNIVSSFWVYDTHYCCKADNNPNDYKAFKEIRAKEYNENMSYRLICIIRNYTQHVDFPNININNEVNENGSLLKINIVKRDLYNFNIKNYEREALDSFPEMINIQEIINIFQDSIERIHFVLSNITKDILLKQIPTITDVIKSRITSNIHKSDKIGIVTPVQLEEGTIQLQITWIPNELIELVKDD